MSICVFSMYCKAVVETPFLYISWKYFVFCFFLKPLRSMFGQKAHRIFD